MNNKDINVLVSVVTINYNGYQDTCDLIESLLNIVKSVNLDIIVVDNASLNKEAELISEKFPDITVIQSEKNLGFAGGNNLGIKKSKGDYIFLLNNDTFIENDGFLSLVNYLSKNEQVAAVSPKILFSGEDHHVQFAGFTPLSRITLRNNIIGFLQPDDGRWDNAAKTPIIHGAAVMVKKSAIEKVGLMPEMYFLYYEELDWSASFLRAGFEMWYIPDCVIYHKGSMTTGKNSPMKTYYMTKNRLLYAKRNLGALERALSIAYLVAIVAVKDYILYRLNGEKKHAISVVNAVKTFFTGKVSLRQVYDRCI